MKSQQIIPPLAIDKAFDEETLKQLSDKPEEYQAQMCDARARTLEKYGKRIYTELGMIGLYMEEKKLWRKVTLSDGELAKSFEAWVVDACPFSRSYLFESKTKMKVLRESGADMKQIEDVPRCNIVTLSKLSSKLVKDPAIIDAAKHMSEDEFVKKIETEHPNQHIERKRTVIFHPDVTGKVEVDTAVERGMKLWECSRDEAIVYIAQSFNEWYVAEQKKAEDAAREKATAVHA